MYNKEKEYFEILEAAIENFGMIQKEFIIEKNGVISLIRFIKNIEGRQPELSLKDPVMQKGREAVKNMINEFEKQLFKLRKIEPPEIWAPLHEVILSSLGKQVAGYKEMQFAFENNDVKHIGRGKEIVKKGLAILEGGTKVI